MGTEQIPEILPRLTLPELVEALESHEAEMLDIADGIVTGDITPVTARARLTLAAHRIGRLSDRIGRQRGGVHSERPSVALHKAQMNAEQAGQLRRERYGA